MNGASWTAAKSTPRPWSRLWSRFRRRRPTSRNISQSFTGGAILLVGAFKDVTALDAARGKLAVALEESEFVCIPDGEDRPVGRVWSGLSRPLFRVLHCDWTEKQIMPIEAPETVRECMRQVLLSGGGIVLVRAADRFPTACDIIHAAGGRVGLPEGVAGDYFAAH